MHAAYICSNNRVKIIHSLVKMNDVNVRINSLRNNRGSVYQVRFHQIYLIYFQVTFLETFCIPVPTHVNTIVLSSGIGVIYGVIDILTRVTRMWKHIYTGYASIAKRTWKMIPRNSRSRRNVRTLCLLLSRGQEIILSILELLCGCCYKVLSPSVLQQCVFACICMHACMCVCVCVFMLRVSEAMSERYFLTLHSSEHTLWRYKHKYRNFQYNLFTLKISTPTYHCGVSLPTHTFQSMGNG